MAGTRGGGEPPVGRGCDDFAQNEGVASGVGRAGGVRAADKGIFRTYYVGRGRKVNKKQKGEVYGGISRTLLPLQGRAVAQTKSLFLGLNFVNSRIIDVVQHTVNTILSKYQPITQASK